MEFYRDASWVLEYIEQEANKKSKLAGSLQTLVLQACKRYKLKTNPKHIYAIIASYWKYKSYLDVVIKVSGILSAVPIKKGKPIFTRETITLLAYDMLLSKKKRIQMGKHPIKAFVLKHRVRLHGELTKLQVKLKVSNLSKLVDDAQKDVTPVRWIRINPIKCGTAADKVLAELEKKFPTPVDHWSKIEPGTLYRDEFIPNLYGVHVSDKITSSGLYKQGKIVIQDRASCFPAHILAPAPSDVVIDACSAPGNKTTHVAAHIFDNRKPSEIKIHAFERDKERAKTLKKMLHSSGCQDGVEVHVGDFTQLAQPKDFPDVTGFILDPSCSGSGIFGRGLVDKINETKFEDEVSNEHHSDAEDPQFIAKEDSLKHRLAKLSSFQFQIVKHAMSFPSAKKLVYSTCSIHAEENERVVIDLLLDKKVQESKWKVAGRDSVIPTWPRRGIQSEFEEVFPPEQAKSLAEGCIRALPKEDGGIGFFAVCFERD